MMLSRRMISKEDESQTEEAEVRREDQDKINRFSRLHARSGGLEEELAAKAVRALFTSGPKQKEDLSELSDELLLADEDSKIPYKIGDSFIHLPLSEAQELLEANMSNIDEEVSALEGKLGEVKDEMSKLKVELYARFGRSINLEI